MSKRRIIVSTLLAISANFAGLALTSTAYAETNYSNTEYWDIYELAEFEEEFNEEADVLCSDASDIERCKEDIIFSRMSSDGKYNALFSYLNSGSFRLLAVNPSKSSLRIYYDGEDKMLKRMLGISETHEADTFYALWVDADALGVDPGRDMAWMTYHERYPSHLGEEARDYTHILVDIADEPGWLPQKQEVTLISPVNSLKNNTTSQLYYALIDDRGGSTIGVPNYAECFDPSLGYQEGMECRLYINENGQEGYLPARAREEELAEKMALEANETASQGTIASQTTPIPASEENTVEAQNTPSGAQLVVTSSRTFHDQPGNYAKVTSSDDMVASDYLSPSANEEGSDIVKNTETDVEVPLASGTEKQHSFPWWLIAIMISGIVLMFWWLIPVSRKREKEEE